MNENEFSDDEREGEGEAEESLSFFGLLEKDYHEVM